MEQKETPPTAFNSLKLIESWIKSGPNIGEVYISSPTKTEMMALDRFGENNIYLTGDLNKKLADDQGKLATFRNSLGQTLTNFAGGTIANVGSIIDLGEAIFTEKTLEDMFANPGALTKAGQSIQEWGRDVMPIFRENPNAEFDITDSAYWGSIMPELIGSTASFLIPGMGVSKGIEALGKLTPFVKIATKLAEKNPLIAQAFGKILQTGGGAAVSRHMENFMEATQSYQEVYEGIKDKNLLPFFAKMKDEDRAAIVEKYGEYFTNDDLAQYIASKGAMFTYANNWTNLAFDVLQFNALAKGTKGVTRISGGQKITDAFNEVLGITETKTKKYANNLLNAVKSIEATEAFEEMINYASADNAKIYTEKMLKGESYGYSDFLTSLPNYLTDVKALEAGFHGVLGGTVFQGLGNLLNKAMGKEKQQEGPRITEIQQRKAKLDDMIVDINQIQINPKLTEEEKSKIIDATKRSLSYDMGILASSLGNTGNLLDMINHPNMKNIVTGISTDEEYEKFKKNFISDIKKAEQDYILVNAKASMLKPEKRKEFIAEQLLLAREKYMMDKLEEDVTKDLENIVELAEKDSATTPEQRAAIKEAVFAKIERAKRRAAGYLDTEPVETLDDNLESINKKLSEINDLTDNYMKDFHEDYDKFKENRNRLSEITGISHVAKSETNFLEKVLEWKKTLEGEAENLKNQSNSKMGSYAEPIKKAFENLKNINKAIEDLPNEVAKARQKFESKREVEENLTQLVSPEEATLGSEKDEINPRIPNTPLEDNLTEDTSFNEGQFFGEFDDQEANYYNSNLTPSKQTEEQLSKEPPTKENLDTEKENKNPAEEIETKKPENKETEFLVEDSGQSEESSTVKENNETVVEDTAEPTEKSLPADNPYEEKISIPPTKKSDTIEDQVAKETIKESVQEIFIQKVPDEIRMAMRSNQAMTTTFMETTALANPLFTTEEITNSQGEPVYFDTGISANSKEHIIYAEVVRHYDLKAQKLTDEEVVGQTIKNKHEFLNTVGTEVVIYKTPPIDNLGFKTTAYVFVVKDGVHYPLGQVGTGAINSLPFSETVNVVKAKIKLEGQKINEDGTGPHSMPLIVYEKVLIPTKNGGFKYVSDPDEVTKQVSVDVIEKFKKGQTTIKVYTGKKDEKTYKYREYSVVKGKLKIKNGTTKNPNSFYVPEAALHLYLHVPVFSTENGIRSASALKIPEFKQYLANKLIEVFKNGFDNLDASLLKEFIELHSRDYNTLVNSLGEIVINKKGVALTSVDTTNPNKITFYVSQSIEDEFSVSTTTTSFDLTRENIDETLAQLKDIVENPEYNEYRNSPIEKFLNNSYSKLPKNGTLAQVETMLKFMTSSSNTVPLKTEGNVVFYPSFAAFHTVFEDIQAVKTVDLTKEDLQKIEEDTQLSCKQGGIPKVGETTESTTPKDTTPNTTPENPDLSKIYGGNFSI